MAIGTRRVRRFRTERDEPVRAHQKEPDLEKELDQARDKFNKAKEEYYIALRNKRSPSKTSNKEELTSAGKTILKGAGKLVDDFFDANMRISDSVERDIRKHSLEGKIDDTIIRALMEKGKSSSRGKGKSTRSNVYVEVRDAHGRPALINMKDIPAALRRRGR